MYPQDFTPWWASPRQSEPPATPPVSTDAQRQAALLRHIRAVVDRAATEVERMSAEWDQHKINLANAKSAMLAAMTLIDQLDKPAIPPAEVVTEDASLTTVTQALKAKVAAHTPAEPAPPGAAAAAIPPATGG